MKRCNLIMILLAAFILSSCKKDKENDARPVPVSDMEFSLYDVKTQADPTITGIITYPNTFILKTDGTWALNMNGAYSYGTYTWQAGEIYRAHIRFTIIQWTNLISNIPMCEKIKVAMETIDQCGFPGPGVNSLNFHEATYSTTLRSIRK